MPTWRTISHCDIYCQGHPRASSSPCSHRENPSSCLKGARWAQGLLTWSVVSLAVFWPFDLELAWSVWRDLGDLIQNQQSSAAPEDMTQAAWQWGEEHVLWVVLWERKNMERLDVLQIPIPVMNFTVASAKTFLLLKSVIAVSPHIILELSKAMKKIRPSKSPFMTEVSLSFIPRHCKYPCVELLLTHHQQSWHHGHQHAEAKTEYI